MAERAPPWLRGRSSSDWPSNTPGSTTTDELWEQVLLDYTLDCPDSPGSGSGLNDIQSSPAADEPSEDTVLEMKTAGGGEHSFLAAGEAEDVQSC